MLAEFIKTHDPICVAILAYAGCLFVAYLMLTAADRLKLFKKGYSRAT